MGKNNNGPRKSWFDLQSERKGKNFLEFWATGTDPDFKFDDNKIRAVDTILRDIKNGLIIYEKDLTPDRLCHPDLLKSIIKILSLRRNFESMILNGFGVLVDIDTANFNKPALEKAYYSLKTKEEQDNFVNSLNDRDKGAIFNDPYACIPAYKSLTGISKDPYINGIRVCLIKRIEMYNLLIRDFEVLANLYNAPAPIGIISNIKESLEHISNNGAPRSVDNKRIPASLDLLSGQEWLK